MLKTKPFFNFCYVWKFNYVFRHSMKADTKICIEIIYTYEQQYRNQGGKRVHHRRKAVFDNAEIATITRYFLFYIYISETSFKFLPKAFSKNRKTQFKRSTAPQAYFR